MRAGGAGRALLAIVLMAAVLIGIRVLVSWTPPLRPEIPFYAAPGTEMTTTKLVGWDDGSKIWEFKARRIERTLDGMVITAEGIEQGTVYEGGQAEYSFSAGNMRYEIASRRMSVGGGIVGRMRDTVFRTESAEVDTKAKIMTVPGAVEVEGTDVTLRADSLEADLAAETVVLRGNAVAAWGDLTVQAEVISYNVQDGSFTVEGTDEGVELTL